MCAKINMVKYMKSRMDRYYKDESSLPESRAEKNKNVYNNSEHGDIDNVDVETSIEVIGNDINSMDINSLRGLLENHYSKEKNLEESLTETINLDEEKLEDTKEYDLKKVLEDAKKNRESDYEKDRFKKIRDTQYDILKNLDLDRKDSPVIDEKAEGEDKLMELIKTVEFNATKAHKKIDEEKDLMSDLLADDEEDVLEPINLEEEETFDGTKASLAEELEKTVNISRDSLEEEETKNEEDLKLTETISEKEIEEAEEFDNTKTTDITTENTFYTGKYSIKSNDFDKDSFEDLEKDIKFGNVFIKILITIIILVVLFIIVYFIDSNFHLGLFK